MAFGILINGLDFHERLGPRNYELVIDALQWAGPAAMDDILRGIDLRGATIADIGIGTGQLSDIFRRHAVGEIIGVDGAREYLMFAEQRKKADRTILADLTLGKIPLPDESVDLVTASGLFTYLGNPLGVLGEMARITKMGGYFAFNFHPSPNPMQAVSETVSAAALTKTGAPRGAVVQMHHHATAEMTGIASLKGANVVQIRTRSQGVMRAVDETWLPLTTALFRKTGMPYRMTDEPMKFKP